VNAQLLSPKQSDDLEAENQASLAILSRPYHCENPASCGN